MDKESKKITSMKIIEENEKILKEALPRSNRFKRAKATIEKHKKILKKLASK
jgi:hypothetical protein